MREIRTVSGTRILALAALAASLTMPASTAAVYLPFAELPERAPRVVDYRIDVQLDTFERLLTGREELTWRNTTAEPATEIHLHLYLNAFRNNRSTFMQESMGSHRRHRLEAGEWGWIELTGVRLSGGPDLTDSLTFLSPDDGNLDDRTVAAVPLPSPVEPGGMVRLEIDFTARLPHAFARTGAKGNFFMVAQWYPKPGVFQGSRGWNCHQFHANSEFFADFGSFDVSITLPQGYVVGATGQRAAPARDNPDGTVTHRFVQEGVHDFAWAADPDFLSRTRRFSHAVGRDADLEREFLDALGYPAADLALPDVEVSLLLQPEHAAQEERIFRAAFAAIRQLGYRFGPYPYETLTIVDPQVGARGAGGMEYPTLITIGSEWWAPPGALSPEGVTVHEFAHQYWYGLVASNEFEEAWLDEGLTTYTTGKVLDAEYGPAVRLNRYGGVPLPVHPLASLVEERRPTSGGRRPRPFRLRRPPLPWDPPRWPGESNASSWLLLSRLGLPDVDMLDLFREMPLLTGVRHLAVPAVEGWRPDYLAGPRRDAVLRPAWEFQDRSSYSRNVYRRPALVLATLEQVLGPQTMLRVMRKYHEHHRFRQPTSADFVATAEDVSGRDLGWLLEPLLHGSEVLDYEVAEVVSAPIPEAEGVFGRYPDLRQKGDGPNRPGQPARAASRTAPARDVVFRNEVLVRRVAAISVPVVVEIEFDDGSAIREFWDGEYRWKRFVSAGTRRVVRATVDPERIYLVDLNWSNNTRSAAPAAAPPAGWSVRLLLWMQSILAFYGGLT